MYMLSRLTVTLAEMVVGFMMGDSPKSKLKISRDLSAFLTALLKGFS